MLAGQTMREIPLTQGKIALVDDEDYEMVSPLKWNATKNRQTFYALSSPKMGECICMHRLILGVFPKGLVTDHINGDGLDNRKENLRFVTNRQNSQNLHIKKSSRFPGVYWSVNRRKWIAQICVGNKNKNLGGFIKEESAYDRYCLACNCLEAQQMEEKSRNERERR